MFLKYLIQSNVYISICSSSLFVYYGLLLDRNFFFSNILGIFFGTLLSYFLVRHVGKKKNQEDKTSFLKDSLGFKNGSFVFLCGLPCLYSLIDLSCIQIFLCLLVALIVLTYEKLLSDKGLRDFPYLKPFVISLCWTIVCVGLHYQSLDTLFLLLILECFLFIFALNLLFDFKDKEVDKVQGLKSLTHIFPSHYTLIFLYLLLCISFLISSLYLSLTMTLMIVALSTCFYLLAIATIKKPLLFAFCADGIILIKCFCYFYFA